ncbi:site-specific integrase [Porcipelethomonas sp.]|uniref:tyrosine-type recombinase/integrase n=1 Tax=Porcipelethomonas sp. TaxID=2981675 RepID=UPI0030789534
MFKIMGKLSGRKKLTLKEIGDLWLQSKKLNVKESSYCNYKRNLEDHIYPVIGDLKYSLITKQQLNDFVEYLMVSGRKDGKGGLSKGTVKDIVTLLKSVSKFAYQEYGLQNVCEGFKASKIKKNEIQVLSNIERKKLEAYLLSNVILSNICTLLSLYTGLRIGEVCGLKWEDIDFKKGCISVNKTVERISLGNGKTKVVVGDPKTESSIRKVYVPTFIIELLKDHKKSPDLFVLSGKQNPTEPRTLQYRFEKILKSAGIREMKFHSLRHTYATICIEKGVDIKTLSELLGHSDVKITLNTYVHSSDKLKRKYVKRLTD